MNTNNYYNEFSDSYIKDTFNCDMSLQYQFFLKYLPKDNNTILDLGFGSARDMLYFKSLGFSVYGIDPCLNFYKHAKELKLDNIYNIDANQLDFNNLFTGIWACASLLHVQENTLKGVFIKCYKALKPGGILYCSFKYGDFIGIKNGRYFIYLTEESIKKYLDLTGFKIIDTLITTDVRKNRSNEKWLNVILKKD